MFQIWMFILLDSACLRSAKKLVKIQESCYDFCRLLCVKRLNYTPSFNYAYEVLWFLAIQVKVAFIEAGECRRISGLRWFFTVTRYSFLFTFCNGTLYNVFAQSIGGNLREGILALTRYPFRDLSFR